jgi:hypothetical protein
MQRTKDKVQVQRTKNRGQRKEDKGQRKKDKGKKDTRLKTKDKGQGIGKEKCRENALLKKITIFGEVGVVDHDYAY